jgi:pimeloyl-ACP methyl ester carboxylesterase
VPVPIGDGLVPSNHPGRRCPRRSGRGGRRARHPDSPADRPLARRRSLLRPIARYDRADRTASIGVPATLIAAGLDQVSTPVAMSALARRLPRAPLHVLPGAAHMTPFTDPAALAQLILRAAGR